MPGRDLAGLRGKIGGLLVAVIKLTEPWGVDFLRTQVRDSLVYHGEEAVLLSLYHVSRDNRTQHLDRCPRCSSDVYQDGENLCPVCYGTNFYDNELQTGGVKDARRVWCMFSDHVISESYGERGVMAPDSREVQCEAFPMLMEHDVIVRVKHWDVNHTALSDGQFYSVDAVTRNSLRTGSQFGQSAEDVVGQKAQCSWLPPHSNGIQLYPIEGVIFPQATVQATPIPNVVVEPDSKVIFYPIPQQPPTTPLIFTQSTPATVWTISHPFNHLPAVTIIVGGEEVDANVDYPSANLVTITFQVAQSGSAELI